LRVCIGKERSGIAWLKARILETTMDKERMWEGGRTPSFWGMGISNMDINIIKWISNKNVERDSCMP